jgi:hypothetical protein
MFVALPAPRSEPGSEQPQFTTATRWVSRTTLSLLALGAWLVTVALGLSLLARRNPRDRTRHGPAASLLPLVAGLGMALVGLGPASAHHRRARRIRRRDNPARGPRRDRHGLAAAIGTG